jgi:hypothetical protein
LIDADIRWEASVLNGKKIDGNSTRYSFNTGAVLFFNTSIGLELLAGYSHLSYSKSNVSQRSFDISLSLHAHLILALGNSPQLRKLWGVQFSKIPDLQQFANIP